MAINFNTAEPQKDFTGAIPPDSIVLLKMTVNTPKAGKQGASHALFSVSDKGNEYLTVEFEVQGTFSGRKIWQNFILAGTSEKAAKISMSTLRAIVESARNINPKDNSANATIQRQLGDWSDFTGMIFLAKIKCREEQSNSDGKLYLKNEIAKIITPDMPEYAKGEQISDKPLPQLPVNGSHTTVPSASKPSFGPAPLPDGVSPWDAPAPQSAPQPSSSSAPQPPSSSAMPAWAKK